MYFCGKCQLYNTCTCTIINLTKGHTTKEIKAMTIKIFKNGKMLEINENTEFFVGRCSSGHTVFGERAYLTKVTANHLVFTTESGSIVKTNSNMNTIGKAKKEGYWVGLGDRTNDKNVIHERVKY